MPSTPLFVISEKGLAAATQATPTGPFIHVTKFAIGSAYGYEVKREDDDLTGDLLYEGQISSYSFIGDGIINIVCKLAPEVGPFDFGEIAIYLEDGTMFAKAAFDNPQPKYSSLGTNLAVSWTFNALLKLEQSVAVFRITTVEDSSSLVLQVSRWTDIVPAGLSADPEIQTIIVKEPDNRGDATFLINSSTTRWTPTSTYYWSGDFILTNASATWVEMDITEWKFSLEPLGQAPIDKASLVVETSDGFFRSVAYIDYIGTPVKKVRLRLNPNPLLNIPVAGDFIRLHVNNTSLSLDEGSIGNRSTTNWSTYSVRLATTSQVPLSGLISVDGIPTKNNDLILVKDQPNKKENGIYIASTGVWLRSYDFALGSKLSNSVLVTVESGTVNKKSLWWSLQSVPVIVGSDDIQFVTTVDDTDFARRSTVNMFTKAQRVDIVELTPSATVTVDMSLSNNFNMVLTRNVTLATPSNIIPGQSGKITLKQDSAGNRIMAFASSWRFVNNEVPVLSTAANAIDQLVYYTDRYGIIAILGRGTPEPGAVPGSQTYSVAGTYQFTVPPKVSFLLATVIGGGGGGQRGQGNGKAGGAGAGGLAGATVKVPIAVSAGKVLTIVVGAGGLANVVKAPGGTSQDNEGGADGTASYISGYSDTYASGGQGGGKWLNKGNFPREFPDGNWEGNGGSWWYGYPGQSSSVGAGGVKGGIYTNGGKGGTGAGGGGGSSSNYNPNDYNVPGGNGGDGLITISWGG